MDKFFALFAHTSNDPEDSLEKMVTLSRDVACAHSWAHYFDTTPLPPVTFGLSNAAGFNKNGLIPPEFLAYLGFNRMVVGTVTHERWEGNPRPRIQSFPKTQSIVNWMGIPGFGSQRVAEILSAYHQPSIPITINLASTPNKIGDDVLADLEGTITDTKRFANRFELNISCPNIDDDYQHELYTILSFVVSKLDACPLYIKVSPDLRIQDVRNILDVVAHVKIDGIVGVNTTTRYRFNRTSINHTHGGASGRVLKARARMVQRYFIHEINTRGLALAYISCGGIDSVSEVKKRIYHGASEIQIYTPLLFHGYALLRNIRLAHYKGVQGPQ